MVVVTAYDRNRLPARFARMRHCLKPVAIDQRARGLASQMSG